MGATDLPDDGGHWGPMSAANGAHPLHPTGHDPVQAALAQLHQSITAEPLPQDFLDLIADIDRKIGKRGGQ